MIEVMRIVDHVRAFWLNAIQGKQEKRYFRCDNSGHAYAR